MARFAHTLLKETFLLALGFPLGFGEGFDAVGWVFEFFPCQQFRDGQDLQW